MRKIFLLYLLLSVKIVFAEQIVVFIHGINSSPKVFTKMQNIFSEDYRTINFGYNSKDYTINQLSEDFLKPILEKISLKDTINFVTHSMGAIILRNYLKNNKLPNIGKIVMIAPPNHGSEVANFFKNIIFYKLRYHKCAKILTSEGIKNLKLPTCKNYFCGIIAGTGTMLPFFSIFIKGKDDGKISVENTKLTGMKDFITVPYPHDSIMKKNRTIKLTENFIRYGKFRINKANSK